MIRMSLNMRKFWGFYKNESYSVGCNGGTVYIYDSTGTELAKFRDFPYLILQLLNQQT